MMRLPSIPLLCISAFLASAIFISCKKEKLRKKYEGDYLFTVHGTYSDVNHPAIDTTFTFEGTIEGYKKKQDKTVYINIWYKSSASYCTTSLTDEGKISSVSPVITGSFSDDDHVSFTTDDLTQDHCFYEEISGVRR